MVDKKNRLTREEQAKQEMDRTTVSRPCRAVLVLLFVILLLSVSAIQLADDFMQTVRGIRENAIPECFQLFPLWEEARQTFQSLDGSLLSRVVEANRTLLNEMEAYETRIQNNSWLTRLALPQAQYFFTRRFGLGNEKAYCGKNNELFYRPDVDFVTDPGFLDPAQMHRRRLADTGSRIPLEPDPLPAIRQFNRELSELGIRLILLPLPVKPSIRAKGLYPRYPDGTLPQNPSYDAFIALLRNEGIDVFDCRPILSGLNERSFLKQDTHWTPAAAERTAAALAKELLPLLPEQPPAEYTRRMVGAANKGDTAVLLRLPPGAKRYGLERVKLQQVTQKDNTLWSRDPEADILLLGDSFSNIYSLPALNWGLSSGFAEQLSYHLQRPLDRISFNDDGSYAARRELARRQAAGENPLKGKRVVIWEFTARELAQGDWKQISVLPDR